MPSYTTATTTVTDNVTKLVWQRNPPSSFPGCTGFSATLGNDCRWDEAKRYCSTPELAAALGGSGWRLPTKIELESIVDDTRYLPALDASAFQNTIVTEVWWTSTPYAAAADRAWAVGFEGGGVEIVDATTYSNRARCVRSDPAPIATATGSSSAGAPAGRYRINAGTVKDQVTGLTWQQKPDSNQLNWQQAAAHCSGLTLDGGGWHLPPYKELLTLVDPRVHDPAIDRVAFPDTPAASFWTASSWLGATPANDKGAWIVDFGTGGSIAQSLTDLAQVRCVR